MPDPQSPGGGQPPPPPARARRILSDHGGTVPDNAPRRPAGEVLRRLSAARRRGPGPAPAQGAAVRALALALCGPDPAAPAQLPAGAEPQIAMLVDAVAAGAGLAGRCRGRPRGCTRAP